MRNLIIQRDIQDAFDAGCAVVALETAVLTHGLPREPGDDGVPINLANARRMERAVREAGAVPATIGIIDGVAHIGLDDAQLAHLAGVPGPAKASVTNLAGLLTSSATAGTTVAATLALCGLPTIGGRIRAFATGGIGGVHRQWTEHPDISADLGQLARTAMCVVCCGPKSLLDVPATLEALQALGVPLVGYTTSKLARFLTTCGDESLEQHVDGPGEAAALCATHWLALERPGAVVFANPTPVQWAIAPAALAAAIDSAESMARERGISGAARTPFVLAETSRRTAGGALAANVALLQANATEAARIAVALRELIP